MRLAYIRYYSPNRFGVPSIGNGPVEDSDYKKESWHQHLRAAIEQGKNQDTAYAFPGTDKEPWLDLSDPDVQAKIKTLPDFPSNDFTLENHPCDLVIDSPRR